MCGAASARRSSSGRCRRITVNLAPAGLRKEGSGFDLSIALAVLAASRQIPAERLAEHAAVGELALDGRVRPVRGASRLPRSAAPGLERILCAPESACEAELGGVEAIPVGHLAEAVAYLRGERVRRRWIRPTGTPEPDRPTWPTSAAKSVRVVLSSWQPLARTTCCSPGHPGRARRCSGAGCRRSAAAGTARGARGDADPLRRRGAAARAAADHQASLPRSPPQCVDGGDRWRRPGPRPGEASLAHRGVLLLDELPEFQRPALEALRQPLEDGIVAVARAQGQALFPARFQLVATMNLCPCAGRGDPAAECSCSSQRLAAFRDKLSRALLDRFDLVVTVPRPRAVELAAGPAEPSAPVRERVGAAAIRLGGVQLRRTAEADELLSRAVERLPLSGRGRARVARVARTDRGARRRRCGAPRARRRGARISLAEGARRVNELALASFAAASDTHLVGEPRSARFAAFKAVRRRAELGAARRTRASLPALAPIAGFPPLLRAIHDPPPGLFLRGAADAELLARPAVAIVGARACSAYGAAGRPQPWPRPGRGRSHRRQRSRARRRRRGPSRRARGLAADRRCPRLRHRPRLSRRAARAGEAGRRARAPRLGIRAGRRARTLALPCAQSDRGRALCRNGRRRGARAKRRSDHRRLRARGGEGSAGGAGRDHLDALGRVERVAAARGDPADLRSGRARGARSERRRPRARSTSARRAAAVLEQVRAGLREPTSSHVRPGCPPVSWLWC